MRPGHHDNGLALNLCAAAAALPLLETLQLAAAHLWQRRPTRPYGAARPVTFDPDKDCQGASSAKLRLVLLEMPLSFLSKLGVSLGARAGQLWVEDPFMDATSETDASIRRCIATRFPHVEALFWLAPRDTVTDQAPVLRGLLDDALPVRLYLPKHPGRHDPDYADAADLSAPLSLFSAVGAASLCIHSFA